jgi:hypothetical protein
MTKHFQESADMGADYGKVKKMEISIEKIAAIKKEQAVHAKENEALWQEHVRRIELSALAAGWHKDIGGEDGGMWHLGPLRVIASIGVENDGKAWLHVSCSFAKGLPEYEDMTAVKRVFIGKDRKAIQVFPAEKEHVNIAEVLHLYSCLEEDSLPDFTHGTGSI